MGLKQNLDISQTILSILPSDKYSEICTSDLKELALDNSVCYVTINKTAQSLIENFKNQGVNVEDVVFIDTITKTIKNTPDQEDKIYYVSSPNALTELSIAIEKFLRHNFDYLVIDSLTNFVVYQKKMPVTKFVSRIINKIKQTKTKAVFYAVSVKEQEDLIKQSQTFVDKVIDMSKVSESTNQ